MINSGEVRIESFSEIDGDSYIQQLTKKLSDEIDAKRKEYIIGVDEDEYKNYLYDKHKLDPLIIDFNSEYIATPSVQKEWREGWRGYDNKYQIDVYKFTVTYVFLGSADIFRVRPSRYTMVHTLLFINDKEKKVSFSFFVDKTDPDEFRIQKENSFKAAFSNYERANEVSDQWNNRLKDLIKLLFDKKKNKYIKENNFFEAINVKVNADTASVFVSPTIIKKDIPQPIVSANKEFSSDPMMSKDMYDNILKVIYESGKSMEKKPSLYQNKDEEGLRDQFLFVLETRYEGTTATGETFNRNGKTDIILKYSPDASNLFVAECKFWHGSSEFLKAISQLLGYLTWRDSKVALIIFVKNKDFSNVVNVIKADIKSHLCFEKEIGNRGETSLSYIFHLEQDIQRKVFLEIIAFHYDQ